MQFVSTDKLIEYCEEKLEKGTIRQLTDCLSMFIVSGNITLDQLKKCRLKADYQALLESCLTEFKASLQVSSDQPLEVPQCPYNEFKDIGVTVNNVTIYGDYAVSILEPLWMDKKLDNHYYRDGYLMPVSIAVAPEYETIYRDKKLTIEQWNKLSVSYRDFLKRNDLFYYHQGSLRVSDLEEVGHTDQYDWIDNNTGRAYRHKTIKRPIYLKNPAEIIKAGKVERQGYKTSSRLAIPQALFKNGLNYDAIESIDCPSFTAHRLKPQEKRASTLRKTSVKSKISWETKFIPLTTEPKIAMGYKIPISAFSASNDKVNDGLKELTYYQPKSIDRKGHKTVLSKVTRTIKVKPSLRLVLDKDRFVKIFDGTVLQFVIGDWSYDKVTKTLAWNLFEDSLPPSWAIFLNRVYDRIAQDIAAKHNKQVAMSIAAHDAEMHSKGTTALRGKSKSQRSKLRKQARSWFFNGGYEHTAIMGYVKDRLQADKSLSEDKRRMLNNQVIGYYCHYVLDR